ncbi:helix-turn-helix transcriptional regulator [Streptomyces lasalocidi]
MDFDAVDALLASVTIDDGLPPPAERRELRRKARLSQAQVAQAVGVTRETVSAWEGLAAGSRPATRASNTGA